VPEDAGASLTVGSTTVALTPENLRDGRITAAPDVAALRAELDANPEAAGSLRMASGRKVGVIAATAVVTAPGGTRCLIDASTRRPIAVELLGGSLASVDIEEALIGRTVLLNPLEIIAEPTCA
jgi:hypothetical protein